MNGDAVAAPTTSLDELQARELLLQSEMAKHLKNGKEIMIEEVEDEEELEAMHNANGEKSLNMVA